MKDCLPIASHWEQCITRVISTFGTQVFGSMSACVADRKLVRSENFGHLAGSRTCIGVFAGDAVEVKRPWTRSYGEQVVSRLAVSIQRTALLLRIPLGVNCARNPGTRAGTGKQEPSGEPDPPCSRHPRRLLQHPTKVSAALTPFWCDRSGGRIVRSDEGHENQVATAGGELAREWADG